MNNTISVLFFLFLLHLSLFSHGNSIQCKNVLTLHDPRLHSLQSAGVKGLGEYPAYDQSILLADGIWEQFHTWYKNSEFTTNKMEKPIAQLSQQLIRDDLNYKRKLSLAKSMDRVGLKFIGNKIRDRATIRMWRQAVVDASLLHRIRDYAEDPVHILADPKFVNKLKNLAIQLEQLRLLDSNSPKSLRDILSQKTMMFSDTPLNQEHIQWLEEKLKHAANVIPPEILKTGGFGKMIKVIMGVVSDRVHYIDPKMSQEKKEKELFKAIQAGYYYGITYPLWDDVMDSHEILSTENKRIAFNIALKGLSGEPIQDSDVPDFNIAKQMKASFDGLQSLYPFNENPELYDALLILTQSQGIDGEHSLDEPITDKGLFLPLITKAAYSRITVPSLSGTQNPLRFENSYHFGLFSQLSDDIGDFVEDERNHRLTPFTYWANRPHDTNVSNPLHTYFGIIEFISRKYKGDNEVRETLLKHARYQLAKLAKAAGGTPGLKVILHRLGESGTPLEKLMITLSESGVNIPNPEFSVYKRVTDRFVTPEHLNRKPTLRDFFARYKEQVNKLAKINITANNSVQQRLIDSMNYSLDAGGKRMRPMLVLMTADLYNIDPTKVFPAARSIELLHTASLIIDDLPAQDNAKLRRGHKTNHLQFDEATAQLAAISLITEAFKGLGDLSTEFGYQKTKEVTDAIAKMSGPEGLSLGQAMDLNRDFGRSENGVKELLELNHLKTGLAIEGSISPIAKLVGATDEEIKALEAFSYHLGAVFQIRDDILDVEGDIKAMGKDTNQDASTRTFVTVLGLQGAKDKLNDMRNLGLVDLAKIKKDTSLFKEMLTYAAERNH